MKIKNKVALISTIVIIAVLLILPGFAFSEKNTSDWTNWKASWTTAKNDLEKIALTPGKNENQLNFAWYSVIGGQAKVRLSIRKNLSDPIVYTGISKQYKQLNGVRYYSNTVTASSLRQNTIYYYQYFVDGKWSKTKKYTTQNPDNFTILYVGDPQIGASVGQIASDTGLVLTADQACERDSFNWNNTLEQANKAFPRLSFILSAGDQINETEKNRTQEQDALQEMQYSGFLSPRLMTSLPVATTIGNHDSTTSNYQNHFNNPNAQARSATSSPAGTDYYFTYGKILFVFLDTNNMNCKEHEKTLQKAISENPKIKWRIVTFHQDIYGSGMAHSATDGMLLRTQLTPLMDKYDIDVVLQGHDHTFSRSYQITGDGNKHKAYDAMVNLSDPISRAEFIKQNECYKIVTEKKDRNVYEVKNPKGVLYMDANSSTGSKFNDLINPMQDYIAARYQEREPSYSIIHIVGGSLSIKTYNADTGHKIDQYTILKS